MSDLSILFDPTIKYLMWDTVWRDWCVPADALVDANGKQLIQCRRCGQMVRARMSDALADYCVYCGHGAQHGYGKRLTIRRYKAPAETFCLVSKPGICDGSTKLA